jgi:hypothetical protein
MTFKSRLSCSHEKLTMEPRRAGELVVCFMCTGRNGLSVGEKREVRSCVPYTWSSPEELKIAQEAVRLK